MFPLISVIAGAFSVAFVASKPVPRQSGVCGDWLPSFDHSIVWVPGQDFTFVWDPTTAPSDGCSMEPSLQNADAATGQGSPWGVYLGFLDPQSGSFTFTIPTPPSPGDYYLQITEVLEEYELILHAVDSEPVTVA